MKKIKQFLDKYKLVVLGLLIFSLYFWNRFLRVRTSKPLPLELSLLDLFIMVYICCIFLYIIISLVYSGKNDKRLEALIEWLFQPLVALNTFISNLPYVKHYVEKTFYYMFPKLEYLIIKTDLFFIIFWIFPRTILVTALFIDIFIFYYFHYKYMVILFGLLLFFNRYFKFSLKQYKKELIDYYNHYILNVNTPYVPGVHPAELEPDYDPDGEDEDDVYFKIKYTLMSLPLEVYINFQTDSLVYHDISREYRFCTTTFELAEELWEKYVGGPIPKDPRFGTPLPKDYKNIFGDKVPDNFYKAYNFVVERRKEFARDGVEKIMRISLLIEYYNKTNNNKRYKMIKIIIYLLYLICWIYVIIISLPYLHVLPWEETFLYNFQEYNDPFSQTLVYDENIRPPRTI